MPLVNVVHGDKLPAAPLNLRVPSWRVPGWAMAAWWIGKGLVSTTVFLIRHWRITGPAATVGYLLHEFGPLGTGAIAATVAVSLGGWWRAHPASFWRFAGFPAVATWRRVWVYRRGWLAAMTTTGLAVTVNGDRYIPRLVKVRAHEHGDDVTVRLVAGQHPDDWAKVAARLAYTFRARAARAVQHPKRLDRVVLQFRRVDSLLRTVAPFPVPAVANLAALPVAKRETGGVWHLRLTGTHVLIAGATDSGKGSVLWSIVSALAGSVRAGLVQLWAFDPKGGMELAAGAPLFARFSFEDPDAMAGDLEDAVKVLRRRAAALRGRARQRTATVEDPTLVILVDEMAALTAYVGDKKTRDRIKDALSLILSQGRAVGVHVVAAVQDPRKDVLPFRDLFPTRIALRLTEPEQADLILGDGSRDRGAICDLIPVALPGVGFVRLDGSPEPHRVRFSFHTDAQLADLAAAYKPEVTA
ncbi:hypothetical cell division FtsK/SpoIIIE protein [Catellatospora sp. IY07-71]|uniref:FtsK/SpoIIIE domain-containing protein n=1 Tax=Catellatospora sp. IY07-71 TaxID=2728827 RepID=UPI001BB3CFE4|nr:FtsK/SpoIIIE domain-containing protein [Catellatospora sp. IY07-71]BCJ71650.1 hypothetical cell division FtsK/SpoIIIE protein [Catellatospora sp. IY07-71]